MFDGTDLSLAYSGGYEAPMPMQMPSNAPQQLPPPVISEPVVPKATASHATAPDQMYSPPPAMYTQQGPSPSVMMPPTESFWERMADKKWDVLKMVVLSLVVVLALSIDRVANHYLTNYMSQAFLTAMQEFLLRIGYPVVVILVLWLMKTLG